jgi:hypothetical protein
VSARSVERLLDAAPADGEAEERAWQVVLAAYAEREPARRPPHRRPALVLAAAAVAVAAAALSPPGRAVVDAVRRTVGIEHAAPALFRLPAPGRLLVSGPGGTWVVAADGSTRRLGGYAQAAWSPHGLYVVAATTDRLAALEPGGRVHWTLARPQIRYPRWGGTRADTRIAYLTSGRLHVVAGDGTGDVAPAGPQASTRVAPAWKPTSADEHVLAYVTTRGRVTVLDTDSGAVRWVSRGFGGPRALAWSADGRRLALATASQVTLFDARSGRAHGVRVSRVGELAFAPDGRLALLRGGAVLSVDGSRVRTVFAEPGRLAGLAWSPDGRWLLTSLPGADQWVFVQARGSHRVLGISHIEEQFGGPVTLAGWTGGT